MSYPPQRYTASTGEASATLRPQGHPPELTRPDGGSVHYLATSASTSGEFGCYRWETSAVRSGADPHFHRTISESFYVLRGAVGLYDGRRWTDAVPGDFLFVPSGGIHGFRNESGESAAMLLLFAPGCSERAVLRGAGRHRHLRS